MQVAKHGFDGVSVLVGQMLVLIHFAFGLAIEPERLSSPGLLPTSNVALQL